MKNLSIGDVVEISGIPAKTIHRWIRSGIVECEANGAGGGFHKRFSLSTAIALKFAAEWRDWGAGLPLLNPLIRHIAGMSVKQMNRAFQEGRTHILRLPDGPLVSTDAPAGYPVEAMVPGMDIDQFNLERVYNEAMETIEDIKSRRAHVRGRNRGLVSAN